MTKDVGAQYDHDDYFKAAARLHQSRYRATVLGADCSEYGNRLTDADGRALMNYYDGLGVREVLRRRFPRYSKKRDADLLRSEHIPFNMLAPLADRPCLARMVIQDALGLELRSPFTMRLEWAPEPKRKYLDDMTSFDAYLQGVDANGNLVGIGIELKYTERGYRIRTSEAKRVDDRNSTYWSTTRDCGFFVGGGSEDLVQNDLRQIWRNHLLGLSMVKRGDITRFVSVTLYPSGNAHFAAALERYRSYLSAAGKSNVLGCTFERYIECIRGDNQIEKWRRFLEGRYIVNESG